MMLGARVETTDGARGRVVNVYQNSSFGGLLTYTVLKDDGTLVDTSGLANAVVPPPVSLEAIVGRAGEPAGKAPAAGGEKSK